MAFRRGCIRKKKPPRLPLYSDPTRWHCSQWNGIPQMCTKSESTPKLFGCYVRSTVDGLAAGCRLGYWFPPFLMPLIRPVKENTCDSVNVERRQFKEQFNFVIHKLASHLGHPFAYPTDADCIHNILLCSFPVNGKTIWRLCLNLQYP